MATFLVTVLRTGSCWDAAKPMEQQSGWAAHASFMDGLVADGFVILGGPLADERRVVLVVTADSLDAVRTTLDRDPWRGSHLRVDSVEPWTLRLDARQSG